MSNENINEEKSVKNAKCLLNRKFYSPTIRLTVSLREPDEESCSVFNFISLITEEVRNRKVKICSYVRCTLIAFQRMRKYEFIHIIRLVRF